MAFVDELTIYAKAGDGGNGIVSWRRLKYIAKGGPAGGDGGDGGDVYLEATKDLSILSSYTGNPKFFAEKGMPGMKNSKEGKSGEDLIVKLPVGSVVTNNETGEVIQLLHPGEQIQILKGGRGGYGNEHFKSSRNVAPTEQTDGGPGEEGRYRIELELVVDLGFIGLPSAGKSSLVNALTGSKAKVAAYHFTTLEPHLGDLYGHILADIPGLIEGAAEGKGLGHKFLRHIKRTRALAHLVSLESDTPLEDYEKIRRELAEYSDKLSQKEEIIVLSKTDMVETEYVEDTKKMFEQKYNKPVLVVSIINDEQLKSVSEYFVNYLEQRKKPVA